METWSGFSAEDIKNVQRSLSNSTIEDGCENSEDNGYNPQIKRIYKPAKTNKPGKHNGQNLILGKGLQRESTDPILYPVPQEAKLSQHNIRSSKANTEMTAIDDCSNSSLETCSTTSTQSFSPPNLSKNTSPAKQFTGTQAKAVTILVGEDKSYKVISSTLNEDMALKFSNELNGETSTQSHQKAFLLEKDGTGGQDKTSLEQFQERQKLMEEQNKRKKELLTKAIADRRRQTQCEAKKLLQVQEELSRLDALLSTDVGILRNQIEMASYEFNEAQKRYDRAESEFIEAKMHLFSKLERKELLTEHLCKIIEVNEQRKARKLSELMAKLEISEDKSCNNLSDHDAPLFHQSAGLNEITYTACTTLKHPNRSNSSDALSVSLALIPKEVSPVSESKMVETPAAKPGGVCKGKVALETVNLITAQSLDHRNETTPCDLNGSESN